jgi:hypothetical protein
MLVSKLNISDGNKIVANILVIFMWMIELCIDSFFRSLESSSCNLCQFEYLCFFFFLTCSHKKKEGRGIRTSDFHFIRCDPQPRTDSESWMGRDQMSIFIFWAGPNAFKYIYFLIPKKKNWRIWG